MIYSDYVLIEKYRPKTIEECILPDSIKNEFQSYVSADKIPNLVLAGTSGTGKAQPIKSKVLTKIGFVEIGKLNIGDEVVSPDGTLTKVIGIYPQGYKDVFEIKFKDGSKTKACMEHLWEFNVPVKNSKSVKKIVNTEFIYNFLKDESNISNLSIDILTPNKLNSDSDLPINPYVLGTLIANGGMSTSKRNANPSLNVTTADEFVIDKLKNILSDEYKFNLCDSRGITYRIIDSKSENLGGKIGTTPNRISNELRFLGLWGKKSVDKFIPDIYKNSSYKQKIELLQGLFDGDGTACKLGGVSYSTSSELLANDVRDVLWSIGFRASISIKKSPKYTYKGEIKIGATSYNVNVSGKNKSDLFTLDRKKSRIKTIHQEQQHRRILQSVEYHSSEECVCIKVESENHLYITDDYIITHNTTCAYALANELGYDILYINGSNEGRSIDTLRGVVTDFASSMSLYSNRKVIIIDEADGIPNLVQEALKSFIEEYATVCSFILTVNNKSKLIPALVSRFVEVNFTIPQDEKTKIAVTMMKRVMEILTKENVTFEKEAIAGLVKRFFPDFRRTLNELQRYASGGQFMLAQLANVDADMNTLIKNIKDKNFSSTVEAIEKMSNVDISVIVEELYKNKTQYSSLNDIPIVIKILSDYLDKASRTSNPKITCLAMIAEIMSVLE